MDGGYQFGQPLYRTSEDTIHTRMKFIIDTQSPPYGDTSGERLHLIGP